MAFVHGGTPDKSEPDHLIEFCRRNPEWCVLVALIGNGQARTERADIAVRPRARRVRQHPGQLMARAPLPASPIFRSGPRLEICTFIQYNYSSPDKKAFFRVSATRPSWWIRSVIFAASSRERLETCTFRLRIESFATSA